MCFRKEPYNPIICGNCNMRAGSGNQILNFLRNTLLAEECSPIHTQD